MKTYLVTMWYCYTPASLVVPPISQTELPYDYISTASFLPKIDNRGSNRNLCSNVHSSSIHSSQKVETTQLSIRHEWWNKIQSMCRVIDTTTERNEILIHTTTWMKLGNMLSERGQTQKATHFMILQSRQIHRDRFVFARSLLARGWCRVMAGAGLPLRVMEKLCC